MIIQNRSKSGYILVNTCARRVFPDEANRRRLLRVGAMAAGAVAVALLIFLPSERFKTMQKQGLNSLKTVFSGKSNQEVSLPIAESTPRTFRAQIAPTDFDRRRRNESEPARPLRTATAAPTEASIGEQKLQEDKPKPATKEIAPTAIAEPAREKQLIESPAPPKQVSQAPVVASLEITPGDARAEITPEPIYSTILGQITLKRNETLSRIIIGVYGGFNSKYFKSFIIANPDIQDPDRVDVGQIISLPAIPASVKPLNTSVWWVRIDDGDSLEAAFNILRNHPASSPALRLIPYWNPSDGTRFAVVLDRLFKDEYTARNHLQQLPAELAPNSTILSRWDKQTVYFANPYAKLEP